MAKFKIGDRVRVIDASNVLYKKTGTVYDIGTPSDWADDMPRDVRDFTPYGVDIDGMGRFWPEKARIGFPAYMLEPIVPLGTWKETFKSTEFDIHAPLKEKEHETA